MADEFQLVQRRQRKKKSNKPQHPFTAWTGSREMTYNELLDSEAFISGLFACQGWGEEYGFGLQLKREQRGGGGGTGGRGMKSNVDVDVDVGVEVGVEVGVDVGVNISCRLYPTTTRKKQHPCDKNCDWCRKKPIERGRTYDVIDAPDGSSWGKIGGVPVKQWLRSSSSKYKVCALNPFFGDSRRGAGVKISSFPDLLAVLSAALVLIAKDDWKLLELHLGSTASFEHIHVKVD